MSTREDVSGVERRLQEWAAWFNAGGTNGVGWPMKSVLHPSWMPPAPGTVVQAASAVRLGDQRERQVHAAIGGLSDKLIVAVVVRYAKRLPFADGAAVAGCGEQALKARVARAHEQLRGVLTK